MNKINRVLFFTLSFLLLASLSACGSPGDLYHPEISEKTTKNSTDKNLEQSNDIVEQNTATEQNAQ